MTTPPTATGFRGSLSETPLPQVLRRIFLEGLKGTLSLVHGDETRHLFFEKGELRTATSSREGQRIGAFLKRRGWITDTDLNWALDTVAKQGRARLGKILVERGLVSRTVLDAEMRRLVEEIVFSTFAWDTGEYKFQASTGVLDPDVALDALDRGRHRRGDPPPAREPSLPRAPGRRPPRPDARDRPDVALPVPSADAAGGVPAVAHRRHPRRGLAAEDRGHLARGDGQDPLRAGLLRHRRVEAGRRRAAGERPRADSTGSTSRSPREPSDRSPGHAELVKNTYRRIDWLTHYELLGVARDAPPEKISEAYFERSRLFHPDLRHREDLARFEKELTAVFERMKKAYETLSDADKRALYDQSLDAAPGRRMLDGADGRSRGAQEAGDAELPARAAAHRGEGLSPGRRDAARGRPLRSGQRGVPLRAVAGRAEEPELDRPGAREPEGGRAPRQPPRRASPSKRRARCSSTSGRTRPSPSRGARSRSTRRPENEELLDARRSTPRPPRLQPPSEPRPAAVPEDAAAAEPAPAPPDAGPALAPLPAPRLTAILTGLGLSAAAGLERLGDPAALQRPLPRSAAGVSRADAPRFSRATSS